MVFLLPYFENIFHALREIRLQIKSKSLKWWVLPGSGLYTRLTAILMIIVGQLQVFQRVSSSKLVLKTVGSCFVAFSIIMRMAAPWFLRRMRIMHFASCGLPRHTADCKIIETFSTVFNDFSVVNWYKNPFKTVGLVSLPSAVPDIQNMAMNKTQEQGTVPHTSRTTVRHLSKN